jgi:hypothetical protein
MNQLCSYLQPAMALGACLTLYKSVSFYEIGEHARAGFWMGFTVFMLLAYRMLPSLMCVAFGMEEQKTSESPASGVDDDCEHKV